MKYSRSSTVNRSSGLAHGSKTSLQRKKSGNGPTGPAAVINSGNSSDRGDCGDANALILASVQRLEAPSGGNGRRWHTLDWAKLGGKAVVRSVAA
ncbi:hypothetical protein OROHE_006125 [Orobanche hederae]